ncbi:MAG: trypsin-like peptidase domain-containing protein [Anaerolineae bacterium]
MDMKREADALDAYSTLVNQAAERVGPAVVKIEIQAPRRGQAGQGQGSGVIFRRDGQILTNAHVIQNADKITVTLADGRRFEGAVMGADRARDVAAIKIGARELPVAELSERPLKIGQLVIAVGNPLGLGWTVTSGVVSALGRSLPGPRTMQLENLIQTDAPINPGSSGGPLVDSRGRVVGITTAVVQFAQGLGFAIPAATALNVLGKVKPRAKTSTQELGLGGMSIHIDEWIINRNQLQSPEGILVLEVKPDSPAEKASLKLLDIIVEVGGEVVKTPADLSRKLKRYRIGESVKIAFIREASRRQVTAILAGRER